jgi:propanol-preferring alcohol dehydrogenase
MRAMLLRSPGDVTDSTPLQMTELPVPDAGPTDVVIRVHVCAVCRTDLDLAEGRLPASHYPIVPGHQVVGTVSAAGGRVRDRRVGDRVGVAWIRWACGECRWCRAGTENLCPRYQANGCDANGGYADYMAVPEAFTYLLSDSIDDAYVAPLLCAGAIGWRSLRLAGIVDGQTLGLTGFGASAHLVLQIARRRFPTSAIYVFARSAEERAFARELGANWAGDTDEMPPTPPSAIIDTTPAWKPVVEALSRLAPGGRLVINAIRKSDADRDELARMDFATTMWMEREIKTVANVTREDVRELLAFAAVAPLRPTVEVLPLGQANAALARIGGGGGLRGATVLDLRAE